MPPADRPESNAAHTAAFPPRLGQGPRLAHVSLRAMEWPFRRTTTSKHVAWAAWCAVALVTTTRGRLRHLAWPYPAATALVVLAPANHFLLDAAGGLAVRTWAYSLPAGPANC
jgi:hypothetical protein